MGTSSCKVCGPIGAYESSYAKYGRPEDDRPLSPAAAHLVTVCGWQSGGRGEELRQCPSCGAWFRWHLAYEFYVNGSEDEETLTRLSDEEAASLRWRLTR
jgi:hypothetical protein